MRFLGRPLAAGPDQTDDMAQLLEPSRVRVEACFFGELFPARKKPSEEPAHKTDGDGNVGQQQVRHVGKAEDRAPFRATTYLADVRIVGYWNPPISAILLPQRTGTAQP